jgi:hypothetical protein
MPDEVLKKTKAKIKLVDQTLIASFGSAEPPLVWQFALKKDESFAFSLAKREEGWDLGCIRLGHSFEPVAHFEAYADALEALTALQRVLFKKKGNIFLRAGRIALWGAVAIFLVWMSFSFVVKNLGSLARLSSATIATTSAPSLPQPQTPQKVTSGVPQSADDVLTAPKD